MSGCKRFVLWFRNDLRLHDNELVAKALSAAGRKEVCPVYVFDSRQLAAPTEYGGARKTGLHRARFVAESVLDLRGRLRALGSELLIFFKEEPSAVLPRVASALQQQGGADGGGGGGGGGGGVLKVLCQEEVCTEEIRAARAVSSALATAAPPGGGAGSAWRLEQHFGSTLHHVEDLPFDVRSLPYPFTAFRNKVEKNKTQVVAPRAPAPHPDGAGANPLPLPPASALEAVAAATPHGAGRVAPTADVTVQQCLAMLGFSAEEAAAPPDARAALHCAGGEGAALARVQHYLWDTDCLSTYFDTRNGLLGPDYSTKFAPWLAHGCLSPRHVFHECARYERERVANKSTYWVVFEMLWRDYFRFYAMQKGSTIFLPGGAVGRVPKWRADPGGAAFRRWCDGTTGIPFVDANMREMVATGFMSNRGRQNVASFLCHDLALDWRLGADFFEQHLTDYDPASNWGNWMFAAGLAGGRVNRFNMLKQAKDYDADGAFVRHWIPELATVPNSHVHCPWQLPADRRKECGCEAYTAVAPLGGGRGGNDGGRYVNAHRGPSGGGAAGAGTGAGGARRGGDRRGANTAGAGAGAGAGSSAPMPPAAGQYKRDSKNDKSKARKQGRARKQGSRVQDSYL